jgi:hypothetical protein
MLGINGRSDDGSTDALLSAAAATKSSGQAW